jgi:hypothetical protein
MIAPPFLEIVPLKLRRLWEKQKSSQAFRRASLMSGFTTVQGFSILGY